jgi:hypothetical protein
VKRKAQERFDNDFSEEKSEEYKRTNEQYFHLYSYSFISFRDLVVVVVYIKNHQNAMIFLLAFILTDLFLSTRARSKRPFINCFLLTTTTSTKTALPHIIAFNVFCSFTLTVYSSSLHIAYNLIFTSFHNKVRENIIIIIVAAAAADAHNNNMKILFRFKALE